MFSAILYAHFAISCTCAINLFSPNIFYSDVYASSVQPGSKPEYVVDADFFEEKPTCFATDSQLPDGQGFHWILIDFGATITNIREIRLITQSDEQDETQVNSFPIEAFVINRLDTPKQLLNSATGINDQRLSLEWDSPHFHSCRVTEASSTMSHAVTLQCSQSYAGRWIAIRKQRMLHICLANIYIEQAFEECFETLRTSNGRQFYGTVYRYVRHTPQEACRSACMQSPDCEANLFIKQRYSGICQLINAFRFVDPREPNLEEATDLLDCPEDKCLIEMNHCHGGTVQDLEKSNGSNLSSTDTPHLLQEEWWVKKPKAISINKPIMPVYVLSVYFEGKLECDAWDCGPVYVVLVDANQTEHFCGRIESAHVSHLEKAILFCNSTDPINQPTSVRLRWYGMNPKNAEASPRLTFHIQRGNIRISLTKPPPPFDRETNQDANSTTTTSTTTDTTFQINTDNIPIIVPQFIGSTEAPVMEVEPSFNVFSSVSMMPKENTDLNHEQHSSNSLVDDAEDIGFPENTDGRNSPSIEFNYLLNDQQPQSDEQRNSVRLNMKVNGTSSTTTLPIPVDRIYEKRNSLKHTNSSIRASSMKNAEALFTYGTLRLLFSLLYVMLVRFIL